MGDELQINFDAITQGAVTGGAAPPVARADQHIGSLVAAGQQETLTCIDMLNDRQRQQARAVAEQLCRDALNLTPDQASQVRLRTEGLLGIGGGGLAGVNATVNRIMQAIAADDIPAGVDRFLDALSDEVQGFRKKYSGDPRVRQLYEKWRDFLGGLFYGLKDFIRMMVDDAGGVLKKLDRISASIVEERKGLRQAVALCDQLYADNETAIDQLVGEIAVMEYILQIVRQHAQSIEITAGDPDLHKRQELVANLGEFVNLLEIRINEFHQRLLVAWATSPQVRNIRMINYGMALRLGMLVELTIPVLKLTIAQWAFAVKGERAARLQTRMVRANNEALDMFAQAMGQTIGQVAEVIQTPSTSPATIMAIAASLEEQATKAREALGHGRQARAEVVTAVVQAGRSINASTAKLNAAMLEVTARARPLELEPPPALPTEVAALAPTAVALNRTGQL